MNDDEVMINNLLVRGADIEALNDFNQTPIFFASSYILNKYGYADKLACITKGDQPTLKSSPKIMKQHLRNLKKRVHSAVRRKEFLNTQPVS